VARLSLRYFVILAFSVLFGIAQVHFRMAIQRRWRGWLSDHVVDRWLSNDRYYQLNLAKGDHANPESRIAEDVRIATE
jgi:putative ATP-binding cassette transporter